MISKIPAAPASPAVRSASPRGTRCPRLGLTSATALALLLLSLSPAFGRDDRQTVQAPVHVMVPEKNQVHLGLARNDSEEYVVFDVANPETPQIVDRVEIGASISALSPSPMGTFIGTQSPRRDIFLRTREPASLRKVISLPGNGKILSLQPLGHLLLVLAEPVDAGSNSFVLDVSEPTKPKLQAQSYALAPVSLQVPVACAPHGSPVQSSMSEQVSPSPFQPEGQASQVKPVLGAATS